MNFHNSLRLLSLASLALACVLPALADDRGRGRGRDRDRGHDRDYDRGGRPAVVLFEDVGFRGTRQPIRYDEPNLSRLPIGNDRASSIRIAPGCVATLYSDAGYRGRRTEIYNDLDDLRSTAIGNDRLSSIRVDCEDRFDWRRRRGAVLYEDNDFGGRSEFFTRDDGNLKGSRIGNDRASSLRVAPGCEVILYSDQNYRGRSWRTDQDVEDLGRTPIGNDRVSSIEVRCRRR